MYFSTIKITGEKELALYEAEAVTESRKDALELLRWNCPHPSSHEEKAYIMVECSRSSVRGQSRGKTLVSF